MILFLPRDVRKRLHKAVRKAGRREVGGVLMAEQIEPGRFHLADFSLDSQTGGAAHFVRSVADHRAALSAFFEKTGGDFGRFNYLGEWHSHPNHLPIPSPEDSRSMESLVGGEQDIPFAVLLIVQAGWRRLACSASLFEQGLKCSRVTLEIE